MGCKHSKFVKPKRRPSIEKPVKEKYIAETINQERFKEEKEVPAHEGIPCKDVDIHVEVTNQSNDPPQRENIGAGEKSGKEDAENLEAEHGDGDYEVECREVEADEAEHIQWDEDEERYTAQFRAAKVKYIKVRPMAAKGERTIVKRAEPACSAIVLNTVTYEPVNAPESNSCDIVADDDSDADTWEREEKKAMTSYHLNARTINVRPQAARGKRTVTTVTTKHGAVQSAVTVSHTRELDQTVRSLLGIGHSSAVNTRDVRFRPKAAKGPRTPALVGATGMVVPTDNRQGARNKHIRSFQAKCLSDWMERQKTREDKTA